MIDFVTSSKVARNWLGVVAVGPLLLTALTACGGGGETEEPATTDPSSQAPPASDAPVAAAPPTGLSPLPSEQQVVNAVPLGRRDPFGRVRPIPPPPRPASSPPSQAPEAAQPSAAPASPPSPGSRPPGPSVPPADFLFSGVIQGAGTSEAVVQYGDLTGTLKAGDRGGATTDLLPPGWSVAGVDVQSGRLILRNRGQRVIVDL